MFSAFAGLIELRFLVITSPADENRRSEGTDVAACEALVLTHGHDYWRSV